MHISYESQSAYPILSVNFGLKEGLEEPRQSQAKQDIESVRADRAADSHCTVSLVRHDDAGYGLRQTGSGCQKCQPHHRVRNVHCVAYTRARAKNKVIKMCGTAAT